MIPKQNPYRLNDLSQFAAYFLHRIGLKEGTSAAFGDDHGYVIPPTQRCPQGIILLPLSRGSCRESVI